MLTLAEIPVCSVPTANAGYGGERMDRKASASQLFDQLKHGDPAALPILIPLIRDQLGEMARGLMAYQSPDHTLQATALVNEFVVRLLKGGVPGCKDRAHFFSIAARAMRQILIDHARTKGRLKRSPPGSQVLLDDVVRRLEDDGGDLERLGVALERLREIDPDASAVVEMRFFLGLSAEQAAEGLDRSLRTVERDWAWARAWLRKELDHDA